MAISLSTPVKAAALISYYIQWWCAVHCSSISGVVINTMFVCLLVVVVSSGNSYHLSICLITSNGDAVGWSIDDWCTYRWGLNRKTFIWSTCATALFLLTHLLEKRELVGSACLSICACLSALLTCLLVCHLLIYLSGCLLQSVS
jgi:hypothetical protein